MDSNDEVEISPLDVLRGRISKIVNLSLDEVEKTLKNGNAASKAAVMKTTLPALIKILGEEQRADELEELRAMVREIHEQDRASIGAGIQGEGEGDAKVLHLAVPEDTAGGG